MKIVKTNHQKIMIFTAVKIRCMLHGRVFVMSYNAEGQAWWPLVPLLSLSLLLMDVLALYAPFVCADSLGFCYGR